MSSRRDFKDSNRAGSRSGKGRGGGLFMGLLLGLVGALVITAALVWYFVAKPSEFRTPERAPEITPPSAPVRSDAPPVVEAPPEQAGESAPNYSFYDILPGSKTPKPAEPPKTREVWWLQVAALKSAEDADRLKAKLTLLNLDTVVQPHQGPESTLYRVRVGPFRSEDAALGALDTLAVNNFEPRLLKEQVTP